MDYKKFSKKQFDKCGIDSEAARMLADLLQQEVEQEIHNVVLLAMENIVQGLNREGHNLIAWDTKVGDVSFRDVSPEGNVRLRLACEVVISSGYAHMYPDDKTPEEIITDVVERLREAMKNTGEES
jgi:hypothetical protein